MTGNLIYDIIIVGAILIIAPITIAIIWGKFLKKKRLEKKELTAVNKDALDSIKAQNAPQATAEPIVEQPKVSTITSNRPASEVKPTSRERIAKADAVDYLTKRGENTLPKKKTDSTK